MIEYNNKCIFFNAYDNSCGVLTSCVCKDCKFFKTEKQYHETQLQAELKLADKGLKAVKKRFGNELIMTTEKDYTPNW